MNSCINLGLSTASDRLIWNAALEGRWTIVGKDSDFLDWGRELGVAPKVVYLAIGNASTADIESLIRRNIERIREFDKSINEDVLILTTR